MNLLLRINIILIFLIIYSNTFSQDTLHNRRCHIVLKGKVLDGESGEVLPRATIIVKEINKAAFTGESGEYKILFLCKGTYVVECKFFGYKTFRDTISIFQNTTLNVVLHTEICELESIVITVEKKEENPSQNVSELSGKELDKTKGLSLGESLKNIPGVTVVQTGPSIFKPVIQGMYGNRVLILNNGVRQEGQQWGNEHAPEIDPFIASKITVIKGASSVKYGSDAIGGVILIDPKPLRKNSGLGGELNLVGFSNNRQGVASGTLDYGSKRFEGFGLRVQGTLKQAGNTKAQDYYLKNTGFKEYNFSGATGYYNSKFGAEIFYSQFNSRIGIFSGSHIGNLTDLYRAINSKEPLEKSGFSYLIESPYQQVRHELFKVKTNVNFENSGKLSLDVARQYNKRAEYDSEGSDSTDKGNPALQFELFTYTANARYDHYSNNNFSGSVGVSGIKQTNVWEGRFFIPNFRSYAGGIFFIEQWENEKLKIEAGIRYDYKWLKVFMWENNLLITPEYKFNNFSGTLGAVYKASDHWTIKTNAGTAFRPPSVNELFSDGLHHGSAAIEIGDRNLVPENAYNLSASAMWNYKKTYGELNVYYNYIHDYIYLSPVFPATLTIRGAFPTFKYKQVNAGFAGFDLSVNDSLSKNFILSSKLSLVSAYNHTANEYLIMIPPTRWENGIRYQFKIGEKLKDTYITLNNILVARKKNIPDSSDYAPPPAAYMLFNLDAGFTINVGKQEVDLGFGINNILNTKYRDYLDRFRYYTDAMGRNFIIRVKIPFEIKK